MQIARIVAVASIMIVALGCAMFFPHAPLSPSLAVIQKVLLAAGAIGLVASVAQLMLTR